MGKKSQQKNSQNKEAVKRLPAQKRHELNTLVDNLLKVCLQPTGTVGEQWEQYVQIQSLLERIQAIESVVKVKAGQRSRESTIDAFTKWAKANGAQFDGLKIAEFPGVELGLEATKPIKKSEALITIPRKLIMSEESLKDSIDESFMAMFSSMPNVKLAFALVVEKLKADSYWKPYLDLLPEKYPTVMHYTLSDMQELKGSNVLGAAISQCKNIARQYAFIYKYAHGLDNLRDRFTYDLYRWAVSTVMTRQNSIPRSHKPNEELNADHCECIPALIPLWDMANHKAGVVTSSFNMSADQLESAALEDFQKGDQVFIYYGDRANADLLVHNGFVYPDNDRDNVSIKLGLSTSDELFAQRTALLDLLKIPKNCELKVLQSPDFISPELLAFVRVFNMNAEQLAHWTSSERASDLLHIDCALETSLETKTWNFLQTRLTLLLRSFPTKLEEDEEVWAGHVKGQAKVGHIKAMLLQYRILEKKVLTNALDYARQRTKA